MQSSDIPAKFPVPFASGAAGGFIRSIPQTTSDPNAASLTLGFPPNTFNDVSAGGDPPDGRDFNGILFQLSAWARWLAAGGPLVWDSGFSTSANGYPKGCVLSSTTSGKFWLNNVDNNTSNPDAGGAGWSPLLPGSPTTGSGWRKEADGYIVQRGVVQQSSSVEPVITVSLPIAFATTAYTISLTPMINNPSKFMDMWVQSIYSSKTISSFKVQYQYPGEQTPGLDGFEWVAQGF